MVGSTGKIESRFSMVVDDKLDSAIVDSLRHSLFEFNRAHAGHDRHKDLLIVLRNAAKDCRYLLRKVLK